MLAAALLPQIFTLQLNCWLTHKNCFVLRGRSCCFISIHTLAWWWKVEVADLSFSHCHGACLLKWVFCSSLTNFFFFAQFALLYVVFSQCTSSFDLIWNTRLDATRAIAKQLYWTKLLKHSCNSHFIM